MLAATPTVADQFLDFSAICDPRVARAVAESCGAVLCGAPLQGTAIGRWTTTPGRSAKHAIKRVHRLLWSPVLARAMGSIMARVAHLLLRGRTRVVVVVDTVEIRDATCALVAGIPFAGRVVPIACIPFANAKKPSSAAQREFLALLARVLPVNTRPIIVTDAGFQGPWLRLIEEHGWDFVARIRHATCVQLDGTAWQPNKKLHARATRRPRHLGTALIGKDWKTCRVRANLVLVRNPPRGRVATTLKGQRRRGGKSVAIGAAAHEPWLLATSLTTSSSAVVSVYASRMKIEQFFRDTKSHAFGRGLRQSFTSQPQPLAALCLVAMLVHIVTVLVGSAVIATGQAGHLQANTTNGHLSAHRVGALTLMRFPDRVPSPAALAAALRSLRKSMRWPG